MEFWSAWLTRGDLALKTERRFLAVAEHKLIRAMSKMLLKPLCVQVLSVNQELPLVRTIFLLVMRVLCCASVLGLSPPFLALPPSTIGHASSLIGSSGVSQGDMAP